MSVDYEFVAAEEVHRPKPLEGPRLGRPRPKSASQGASRRRGTGCTHETYKEKCELTLPTRDARTPKTIDEQIDELVFKLNERLRGVNEEQRESVISEFFDEAFSCPEERTCFAERDNYGGPRVTDARHKHVISRLEKRLRSAVE
jgi:hypothetical protein